MEEIHRAQSGRGGGPEDPSPLQSCHAPPDIDVFINPETKLDAGVFTCHHQATLQVQCTLVSHCIDYQPSNFYFLEETG